jgi:hypothetical protein
MSLLFKLRIRLGDALITSGVAKYWFVVQLGKIEWTITKEFRHFEDLVSALEETGCHHIPHLTTKGKLKRITVDMMTKIHAKLGVFIDELISQSVDKACERMLLDFLSVPLHLRTSVTVTNKNRAQTLLVLALHRAIFARDLSRLTEELKNGVSDINEQDYHGNTPLHLAAMTGMHEAVPLLLQSKADVLVLNYSGWSALDEAVSYGHRPTIRAIWYAKRERVKLSVQINAANTLQGMKDFYLEMKWLFSTWVPLVSNVTRPPLLTRITLARCPTFVPKTLCAFGR